MAVSSGQATAESAGRMPTSKPAREPPRPPPKRNRSGWRTRNTWSDRAEGAYEACATPRDFTPRG